ncbi:hydroxyisourate hydrolase [Nocardioides sp. zg-536]|uniref:5-hydroxyisourate hydrolase n=1 Tax=Nocardioides faecalis TaxID=2803858 RepID=A0A939BY56_9ACTN|nr:hydroxyisourate hydrolase [Nocardioides faecalis]MBM9459565.1 hydroxyisourate hydrolase [Nocardioides faecalis]QVI58097.1 hydroxyisourate hydrolase [Nocardioides faecalis]
MSTCSTHVLDAALGRPAAGLDVELTDAAGHAVATAVTDADGRVRFDAVLPPGPHRLVLGTGEWFADQDRATLYPEVSVAFAVTADEHYHVAVLLSPFSYTTYRGS